MGAPKLVVNGIDLSTYLMVQDEEGLDPAAPAYFTPQYAGSGALRDGRRHVADTADNREGVFPLLLEGKTRAGLHHLISEINAALVRNASVEFASDSSDASDFFTLEGGHLDVKYQYFLTGAALTTRATLHLSTHPYSHTGTMRGVASIPQGSSAVVAFPATGILGDVYALANIEVRVGSAVASAGRVVMFGAHAHPSNNPYREATSGRAQTGATVLGASGAIGSQYTAIPISPTGASGVAYQEFLDPPNAHVGRHRVIAFARSGLNVPIPLYAMDRFGAILGATAVVTQMDQNKWQVVDLGEVQVPARATGQEGIPTQYVNLFGGGASGAAINASPGFHLAGLLFLPLDYSAGIMRTPGAGVGGYGDTFSRGEGQPLESSPQGDLGGIWNRIGGNLEVYSGYLQPGNPNGSGFYTLASGAAVSDVTVQVPVQVVGVPASVACSSSAVIVYPKMIASEAYTRAYFSLGPSPFIAIQTGGSPGQVNLRASAGMPSMLASGYLVGQRHILTAKVKSGRMDVWLATGPLNPSPIVSATHVELGIAGNPALFMLRGPK